MKEQELVKILMAMSTSAEAVRNVLNAGPKVKLDGGKQGVIVDPSFLAKAASVMDNWRNELIGLVPDYEVELSRVPVAVPPATDGEPS